MQYIKKTLLPDEKIIYYSGPHFFVFYPCFIWIIATIGLFLFLPQFPWFLYFTFAVTIFYAISSYIIYISSEYGITDKRILMKVGLIRRASLEIFFHKIESININQTIPGRIFNYGTVVIVGTGGSKDTFPFVPNPLKFRRCVQEQMEKVLQATPTNKIDKTD
jgi:uncharacterized membrane protein YdbT with pleckstrin-like domain